MFYFITFLTVSLFFLIVVIYHIEAKNNVNQLKKHDLSYNENTRQVILDGCFVLTSFRQGSLNCSLFQYLNQNRDKKLSYDELNDRVFKGRHVELNKVVDAMGFRGDLKRILFSFDANSIIFHPEKINQVNDLIRLN